MVFGSVVTREDPFELFRLLQNFSKFGVTLLNWLHRMFPKYCSLALTLQKGDCVFEKLSKTEAWAKCQCNLQHTWLAAT